MAVSRTPRDWHLITQRVSHVRLCLATFSSYGCAPSAPRAWATRDPWAARGKASADTVTDVNVWPLRSRRGVESRLRRCEMRGPDGAVTARVHEVRPEPPRREELRRGRA